MVIKYYNPSRELVEYLQEELQNRQLVEVNNRAAENDTDQYRRKEESRNNLARKKNYHMEILFESLANILYFVEFVENHYNKLNSLFEEDLKDLLGFNESCTEDEFGPDVSNFPSIYNKNPGGPIDRFISSIFLQNKDNMEI